MYIWYNYCMSILYLHYDKFYILWVVLTLYGLTEFIMNECMNEWMNGTVRISNCLNRLLHEVLGCAPATMQMDFFFLIKWISSHCRKSFPWKLFYFYPQLKQWTTGEWFKVVLQTFKLSFPCFSIIDTVTKWAEFCDL